ncbi:restriction endonuclease subunit S [Nevskia ramosa]|uniref:restriction endonuclease subunit S n=1 Tax=Nevskia ramosa TaxID=64002 RepID=UPI003D0F1E50
MEIPNGWSITTLGSIATSAGGGTPSKADPSLWSGGTIPWISPKDMKSLEISFSSDSVTAVAAEKLTLIPAESVLVVVRSGILSRTLPVGITRIPVTINQDMRAFIPKAGISSRFVALQLVAKEHDVLANCAKGGTTVASIEGLAFASFPLWLAPEDEQTRIVTKLEELLSDLDAGVAELKAAQKKLAQYRQSLLKSAVEGRLTAEWRKHNRPAEAGADLLARILAERRARWEAKQLAKFNEQGKTPPKGWQASYPEPVTPDTAGLPSLPDGWVWSSLDQLLYELRSGSAETSGRVATGYPILKSSAVRQGEIDFTALNFLDSEQSRAENFLEIGDVLITRLSGSVEYVGCCAVVDSLPAIRVQFPDRIFRGKVFSGSLVGHYLAFCLRSHQSRQRLEAAAKSTAGHKRISLSDLHPFPIPLPPEAEGLKIVESLRHSFERIERMASEIELGLKQSTAQRKNILRAAFAGQLVPQDPNDEPASALLDRIRVARKESAAVPHRRKIKGRA